MLPTLQESVAIKKCGANSLLSIFAHTVRGYNFAGQYTIMMYPAMCYIIYMHLSYLILLLSTFWGSYYFYYLTERKKNWGKIRLLNLFKVT